MRAVFIAILVSCLCFPSLALASDPADPAPTDLEDASSSVAEHAPRHTGLVVDMMFGAGSGYADVSCRNDAGFCIPMYVAGIAAMGLNPVPAWVVEARVGAAHHADDVGV